MVVAAGARVAGDGRMGEEGLGDKGSPMFLYAPHSRTLKRKTPTKSTNPNKKCQAIDLNPEE